LTDSASHGDWRRQRWERDSGFWDFIRFYGIGLLEFCGQLLAVHGKTADSRRDGPLEEVGGDKRMRNDLIGPLVQDTIQAEDTGLYFF
jgi:hypothetical protein